MKIRSVSAFTFQQRVCGVIISFSQKITSVMEKPASSGRRSGKSGLFGNVMFLFLVIGVLVGLLFSNSTPFPKSDATTIFDFSVETAASEQPVALSEYKGKKAYLVVNVASQCGLTNKNYAELTELYDKYR